VHPDEMNLKATVLALEACARNTFRMRLHQPAIAGKARAGQFVNLRVPDCQEILWRRPFSIHRTDPGQGCFDLLFHVVGRGTRALGRIEKGTELDLLGPLGNGFEIRKTTKRALLVAGGLGIAPFALLLTAMRDEVPDIGLFYGVESREDLIALDQFKGPGIRHYLTTRDGSEGVRGVITDLVERELEKMERREACELYVCGPKAMLVRVQELVEHFGVRAQVSVENTMACGFGACMGCAVTMAGAKDANERYLLACTDGPVFMMDEIVFDA